MNRSNIIIISLSLILLAGCQTTSNKNFEKVEKISFLFAGDIMAHKPNFNMKNYPEIWKDIKPIVESHDFSFANIEAPVSEDLPYSSFPNFNMHQEYPEEAIKAGFNVFSLVNNHTNDQALEGMMATLEWADKVEKQSLLSDRQIFFSGIKKEKTSNLDYKILTKDNWNILYCAATEILNRPTFKEYMNFVYPGKKGRNNFIEEIRRIRQENSVDLFVLSLHTDEAEYVAPVEKSRRDYYMELLNAGVDVLWTNHPHIPREKEFIGNGATQKLEKVIIYGNGNVISGQRWEPDFNNPSNPRDDTGDSYLLEIVYEKTPGEKPFIKEKNTIFITTYITRKWEFVIKKLDDEFINELNETGNRIWSKYLFNRKQITEKTKETITWQ